MPVHATSNASALDDTLVEHAMHRGVASCPYEAALASVARMMATRRVHCVVGFGDATEDDTRLWGVVTDRDVLAAAAGGVEALRTAGDCASSEVVTIGPHSTVRRAAQLMHERGVAHLVVVEPGSDRPLGILSSLDVAAVVGGVARPEPKHGGSRADELMTSPVVTVTPDTPLKDVATLLVERGISGVPVVRGDEVVGVVSEADIVGVERGAGAATAGEAMSAPPVTIAWWQSAAAAATLMNDEGVKRLPVVMDGRLVGILSRRDLVRAFVRTDEEIVRDIHESVIVGSLWIAGDEIDVDVHAGAVELSGTVERRDEADLLLRLVRKVPGVVSVSSSLTVRGRDTETG